MLAVSTGLGKCDLMEEIKGFLGFPAEQSMVRGAINLKIDFHLSLSSALPFTVSTQPSFYRKGTEEGIGPRS